MKPFARQILAFACLLGTLLPAAGGPAAGTKSDELVAEAVAFQSSGKTNEALWAYRQAAKAGNVQGALAAGDWLLTLGRSGQGREQVLQVAEGLGDLYFAATNRQPQACARLAEALQNGIGVPTNLVSAYAWLHVATATAPAFQPELDQLALRLEPVEILQGQQRAREYLSGHWPAPVARPVDQGDPRLQVQGVSQGARAELVILNGETLAPGESVNVVPLGNGRPEADKSLTVSCRAIGRDYLLVAVSGEVNLKLLPLETP